MKFLLVVGSPQSDHESVFERLSQTGVARAQACRKEKLLPQALHALMLRSHEIPLDGEGPLEQLRPGKLWNELAADLFLANINQPLWGWADHQSALLLDFWQEFDPQVRFLLVYAAPHAYLARALAQEAQPTAELMDSALRQWSRWNTALLRYFHRHPARCVLVNSQEALGQAQALATELTAQWQIHGLNELPDTNSVSRASHQTLQEHLARQLIDDNHPVWALFQELECSAHLPSVSVADTTHTPRSTWGDWVSVRGDLSQALKDKAKVDEFQKENELLLVQLHQVQEELDRLGSQAKQAAEREVAHKATVDTLQAQQGAWAREKAELTQARDALASDKNRFVQQLEQLESQLKQAPQDDAKTTELQQENELLLLQLHQVQEELEHYFLQCQELENQQNAKATGFVADFWRMHQPQELRIDMRQDIAADNWYPAEADGRWAGPATISTIELPPLQSGQYCLELDVVDAMDAEIVTGLQLEAFGQTWPLQVEYPLSGHLCPLTCRANLAIPHGAPSEPWHIGLRFPKLISPADSGSADQRHLALRLRTLRLAKLAGND